MKLRGVTYTEGVWTSDDRLVLPGGTELENVAGRPVLNMASETIGVITTVERTSTHAIIIDLSIFTAHAEQVRKDLAGGLKLTPTANLDNLIVLMATSAGNPSKDNYGFTIERCKLVACTLGTDNAAEGTLEVIEDHYDR